MILVLKPGTTEAQIGESCRRIESLGFQAHVSRGRYKTIIGVVGKDGSSLPDRPGSELANLPWIESVIPVMEPYKLAGRETAATTDTVVDLGGVQIGGGRFTVMAGPCAVESREQLEATAAGIKKHGAHVLRGGAFKPRTSPYDFQGLEEEGLQLLREVREKYGLPVITEALREKDLEMIAAGADIVQIGARNIQNFSLLRLAGQCGKPVLLKRGLATTIKEFLMAAEYILAAGNPQVILCERGIRTFETATRSTLDISAVPVLREKTHLPVIVDPSHAAGKRSLVPALARAALAAGADGLLIEVHYRPETALCDARQQLTIADFARLMTELRRICQAVDKRLD